MDDVLAAFHPLIAAWFRARFGAPTEPQRIGWPHITAGRDVLIAAPTGSGKTLAAFLACLNTLVLHELRAHPQPASAGTLSSTPASGIAILYLSPLKALSNDVQRNLQQPLQELAALAAAQRTPFPTISVGVRTGDTPMAEREQLAKHPPHILVTTPESLYIMLTTARGRHALRQVRTVIVDEIHAIAGDKRGAHLALSLERLDRLVGQNGYAPPVRVGLSATQRPMDRIARLLVGYGRPLPVIVDGGHRRDVDLAVEITDDELGAVASHEQMGRVYDRIAALVTSHQSTIVFVNTRRLVERVAAALETRLGADHVVAHHGSMSRAMRLAAEEKLKFGQVKCAVATASLELGIDVGAVDLVVQLGSPRSLATFLQRVGRSGHHLRGTPKGRLFALTRDQLVECAALVRGVRRGNLDEIVLREAPLDILAQQMVAMVAAEEPSQDGAVRLQRAIAAVGKKAKRTRAAVTTGNDTTAPAPHAHNASAPLTAPPLRSNDATKPITDHAGAAPSAAEEGAFSDASGMPEAELWACVTRAANYHALTTAQFEQVVQMLADGISSRRGRAGAHVFRDRVRGVLRPRRGARLAAVLSGGAIPDNNNYAVLQLPEGIRVGEVDEDFAIDSSAGDIFQLGNTAWKLVRVEIGRVFVEDAQGQPPTIPHWFGEAPARTKELSQEASDLRKLVDDALAAEQTPFAIAALLQAESGVDAQGAAQLVAYLAASRVALGALPRTDLLVAERFFDEAGGMQLVLHAPLGGRINRAWGLALRKRFCRSFDFELQAAATDDGIVISLGQPHSFALESVFTFLPSHLASKVLVQALLDQPMFEIRWRWNATRALAVLRRHGGEKVPPHLVKMRCADLLSVVFPQAQACLENISGDREIPEHPLVEETVRDCLVEAMDIEGFTAMLQGLEAGAIAIVARDTVTPSPLSHELISANPYAFLDNAGLEDRRTRAVTLRRGLPAEAVASYGALDATAIATAVTEVTPVVRSRDEMHDVLMDLWLLPAALPASDSDASVAAPVSAGVTARAAWLPFLQALATEGRAAALHWQRPDGAMHAAWVALEHLASAQRLLPQAQTAALLAVPTWVKAAADAPEVILARMVSAHLDHSGPATASALATTLGVAEDAVRSALLALETDGGVMRGRFTAAAMAPSPPLSVHDANARVELEESLHRTEWCNRRILARIHHLTLAALRKEIQPVAPAAFMRFLLGWQRTSKNTQLRGPDGLLTILAQLQGFDCAAASWEREVLPARLQGYDAAWLDTLCLGGQVAWCRTQARTGTSATNDEEPRLSALTMAQTTAAVAPLRRNHATPPAKHRKRRNTQPQPSGNADTSLPAPPHHDQGNTEPPFVGPPANDAPHSLQDPWAALGLTRSEDRRPPAPPAPAIVRPRHQGAPHVGRHEDRTVSHSELDRSRMLSSAQRSLAELPPSGFGDTGEGHAPHDASARDASDLDAVDRDAAALDAVDRDALDLDAVDCDASDLDAVDYDASDLDAVDCDALDLDAIDLDAVVPLERDATDVDATNRDAAYHKRTFRHTAAARAHTNDDGQNPLAARRRLAARGPFPNHQDAREARQATIDRPPLTSTAATASAARVPRLTPNRAAPLTLALRSDLPWIRAATDKPARAELVGNLSDAAQRAYQRLLERGACFLAELVHASALPAEQMEDALWELVTAGLASADGFAALRVLVDRKPGTTRSHFDTSAATAAPAGWRAAVNQVRQRDRARPVSALRALPTAAGRWSLLPEVQPADRDIAACAKQLLQRYGVVFRDLLVRETNLPPWRDLLGVLRSLEARGEIRGGRFVHGYVGEQFALPEALDALRAARHVASTPQAVVVAACDPLNLVGILSPGPRVPALLGNAVLYVDGVAVASRESGTVQRRPELAEGALVADDLTYTPPPPTTPVNATQLSLM